MAGGRTLSEAASKELLSGYGIPTPTERLALTPAEAASAAAEVGLPAVAKLCGEGIAHKTERGLVRLALDSEAAVAAAAEELLSLAEPADGDVAVLVAPMVSGTRELIAGLAEDPNFGMTVLVGLGGIMAEALGDVAVRLVPIERVDAVEMIDDLRTQALLGPFRGEPALDRERLADLLMGLSQVAQDHPEIVSVDLNPLRVVQGTPLALDALVEVRG